MDVQEETFKGIFLPHKVVSCTLALVFPREVDIRRRANELEDVLKGDYRQPQVTNAPDEANSNIPRFVFPSRDGRSVISVSQTIMQLDLSLSDGMPSDLDSVAVYINERYRALFDALTAAKTSNPFFFGVTTVVQIPATSITDELLLKLVARALLKSPDQERGYHDLQVKRTKIAEQMYFDNILLENYRIYPRDVLKNALPRTPREGATEFGVEITSDVNDRFAYSEQDEYQTSDVHAGNIIRHAVRAVKETITEMEAIE